VTFVAPIGCGIYLAGHDVHPIAMRETVDRAAVPGRLTTFADHAAFTSDEGERIEVWTHDLVTLQVTVGAGVASRLQVEEHLVWIDLIDHDGMLRLSCVNVAFDWVEQCRDLGPSPGP
jgi:hypothetical protein